LLNAIGAFVSSSTQNFGQASSFAQWCKCFAALQISPDAETELAARCLAAAVPLTSFD
jgi:hypothetical protein